MTNKSDDELMQEAMQLLSQEPPLPPECELGPLVPSVPSVPDTPAPAPSTASQTLAVLAPNRHPRQKTVCESCPNSVWFSSPTELKCYCRVMYLVTWSNQSPNQLTHCDGLYLGQDE